MTNEQIIDDVKAIFKGIKNIAFSDSNGYAASMRGACDIVRAKIIAEAMTQKNTIANDMDMSLDDLLPNEGIEFEDINEDEGLLDLSKQNDKDDKYTSYSH